MHSPDDSDSVSGTDNNVSPAEPLIRERAYQIYELRGREDGHADEDWYQAEVELLDESHHDKAA